MATYTVDAIELEGVVLYFHVHHEASVPNIHHTFNAIYGIDLYATDFHFIFDNVTANGLKKLYKDASKRLLMHMVDHIKQESGAITRDKTKKVEALFGIIQINYKMNNGTIMNFKRG